MVCRCPTAELTGPSVVVVGAAGLRPLRVIGRSWGDESVLVRKDGGELGYFAPWNVTGTYEENHLAILLSSAQIRIEGVYIWPFRQLWLVAYSGRDGDANQDEEYILSNPYHLILLEKYSYYRRFTQDMTHSMDCVICMTSIDLSQHPSDCMVTPCDHYFHSGCLQRWMDIKMEFPTCRRTLPPA
ncbi:hypothetical protein MLD38_015816 [Melastoma candidum]|uniref:Uncharacterized protein n=1 Tax=Melastoma candidum TaxID=119954 RepID=A0ACB9RHG3_9MYRT|nr:hypothetical protein MLD38_015816 [Melastoma candidum]